MKSKSYKSNAKDIVLTTLAVLLIPTLIFWVLGEFLFINRAIFNVDYLIVCFLLIYFGAGITSLAIAIVMILDLVFSMAPAYHFSLGTVLDSVRGIFDLNPAFLAFELLKVMLLVSLSTLLIYFLIRNTRSTRIVAATCILLAITLVSLDIKFSANALAERDVYTLNPNISTSSFNNLRIAVKTSGHSPKVQSPLAFDSASEITQISDVENASQNPDVILIVVESLGQFKDPRLNHLQLEPLLALKNEVGVEINHGIVEFDGSTVPGELRELCGIRLLVVHPDASALPVDSCLPEVFNSMGYKTLAIHGFVGAFFSRSRWYPTLFFEDIWFAPSLSELIDNANRCGIAFHGICDEDIWRLIVQQRLANPDSPQFTYWLTLSAHLPVEHSNKPGNVDCSLYKSLDKNKELCNLVEQHQTLFSEIATSIRKGEVNGTRILLVGDHAPPFLNHDIRDLFSSTTVPYIEVLIPGTMPLSN